jgi:hypothetical protein
MNASERRYQIAQVAPRGKPRGRPICVVDVPRSMIGNGDVVTLHAQRVTGRLGDFVVML